MYIWTELNTLIENKVDDYKERLANGGVGDYNEYTKIVGHIQGMYDALGIMKKVLETRVDEEDEL